jgi:hypothetical protein
MTCLSSDHQVVHLDEHRGALDRVEFDLRRLANVASYSALLQRTRLRLAHLLAFCAICSVVNCSMKNCGSGCVMVVVYICMSAQNFW